MGEVATEDEEQKNVALEERLVFSTRDPPVRGAWLSGYSHSRLGVLGAEGIGLGCIRCRVLGLGTRFHGQRPVAFGAFRFFAQGVGIEPWTQKPLRFAAAEPMTQHHWNAKNPGRGAGVFA